MNSMRALILHNDFCTLIILLYSSGNVVTMECVERLIKPDMICPITGQKLKESDIIAMKRVSYRFLVPDTKYISMLKYSRLSLIQAIPSLIEIDKSTPRLYSKF